MKKIILSLRGISAIASALFSFNAYAVTDHSVKLNTGVNQMYLSTSDNTVRIYNTADLSGVDIDKVSGKITVTPNNAGWTDEYIQNVSSISFPKSVVNDAEGAITNRGVN
ncbi:MAG: hypothetical protein K2K77_03630, partial [Duncaniella sp.]|nr:hypothetical protein [Duncaniella sp.]